MTIDEYAAWAARIGKVEEHPSNERLSYLGLGLAGEAGEVADHIKKLLRDGWLDQAGLVDELGDVVYYWACLCAATGQQPSDVLKASAARINRRLSEAASR
ncbi:nucleoside triphosphate pyrophosphohydrolase family protein [Bradyrhizobium sp. 147]|uniref:nucleoside triphosphate pyrophosphohydrolase family protein n=1 Tax=unclassified Bradyrhizobium TaxID=2631580 RepID=UPI001FF86C22|nr:MULTISPECIES: nucleoside triphosphate pyrophosphohydrolase family protein [unclassified Bradyrhizobium]MCK1420492.1 nucleoside triphosphate pyrophosphohydrolase family protein [Bradyrhizobium sp. CW12]MCK1491704.1 nucleoside triphosphate pyrophosphohydrolase family protein [Bradyrhizobium sp. 180]MCK1531198.1 nucleoside triphosphate pyrophosphohydrolase family protein [Bradyrhizobium sp. 182]MCK1545958.1 nucleoside triphosphate pyrophosphohydrolase family protein [Bradyrhizobium sp. 179]MCK